MDNTNQTDGKGVIGRVCLFVELDGEPCIVNLSDTYMRTLVQLAASLNMGKLPVVPAPEGFEFRPLSEFTKHDQEVPNA